MNCLQSVRSSFQPFCTSTKTCHRSLALLWHFYQKCIRQSRRCIFGNAASLARHRTWYLSQIIPVSQKLYRLLILYVYVTIHNGKYFTANSTCFRCYVLLENKHMFCYRIKLVVRTAQLFTTTVNSSLAKKLPISQVSRGSRGSILN